MERNSIEKLNGQNGHRLLTKLPEIEIPATVPQPEQKEKEVKPVSPPSGRGQKRKLVFLVLGLGLGASVLGTLGYQWWQNAATHQETDNATVVGHLHPVASRVTGTVAQVLVDDNQQVKPGQLLVKLDPQDYQVKVLLPLA